MTSAMYILGIHDGHNCGATLICDGQVVASVSEERLTRRKNEVGYPKNAIEDVLRIGGVEASQLTEIVYASLFMHSNQYLTELDGWYKVGIAQQRENEASPNEYQKIIFNERKRERIAVAARHLGVDESKIHFIEHHLAHLAAAYFTAPGPLSGKPVLGLTCDGAGDGLCATVSRCLDNKIERLAATDRHASLGKIYSRVTFLLGMTPWEHEYKLMGLAPYADPDRSKSAAGKLRELLQVRADGLGFDQVGELSTNYCYEYLRDAFERIRFDTIAGATQMFTEEMMVEWVRGAIRETGLTDIVAGGGVFMNVKANMLIANLPEVTSFYVMPSAADESLSIGAALYRYYQLDGRTDHRDSRLNHLYLGSDYSRQEEEEAIERIRSTHDVEVAEPNDINGAIANLLAKGEIVANCRGRMEWGARALGNRSILTSADDYRNVDTINQMIKMRDFWMPFAPSIREEAADRYFDDPKDLKPWFMTFGFPSKLETYPDLTAGSHPRDRTIRPQVVTKEANPAYHEVISAFEDATGRGVVLNTSFNLHGEPIVYSPTDAGRVFVKSGLRHLAFDNMLISKR